MGGVNRDLPETASVAGSSESAERREPPGASAPAAPPPEIHPGDCLGRYTVRGLIGAGGMGRVFAAVDPELGRTVALKLIRPDRTGSPRARARLLREAQALARLHHPNVVTVYDVGTQGADVFIALELVEGPTLAEWLRAGQRGWREIVAAFAAAGRGLAAAHAQGIVHRDFKPQNVVVGADRVVVVDFGLARAGADEPIDPETWPAEESAVLEVSLTMTGERVGTELYMSPEQRAGGEVTPKADQYSFSVALWEALHGERPIGQTAPPRRSEVPGWLNAAVLRGRARDPAERWPELADLLAALGRDPWAVRRRILAAAAVLVLGGLLAWAGARSRASDPCGRAAARLAGVWDAPRKQALHAAFAATGVSFAEDAWRLASARLDEYAGRFTDMHAEACRATRIEGRQSDTLMDLRMACLDRRRSVLSALTGLWARGMDADSLAVAADAARDLPPLAECADAHALNARVPLPADPAQAARIADARARLDSVQALILAHRWAEARKQVGAVRAAADATGWLPVRAEAAFAEGDVLHDLSDPHAEPPFLDAHRLAGAGKDDRLAARALIELVKTLAVDDRNTERALAVADIADGAVARAGNDAGLRAQLLSHRGDAFFTKGKFDAARAAFTEADKYFIAAFGPRDSATLWNQGEIARAAHAQGKLAEARELLERNLAATIELYGAEHPTVASKLNNLGLIVSDAGDNDAASAILRRALAIKEKVGGSEVAWTAMTLNNLGIIELVRGHIEEARGLHERALLIRERIFGPDHALVANSLGNLANVRRKQGRFDEALELLRRALAIDLRVYGRVHGAVSDQLTSIADVLDVRGDPVGALGHYQQALEIVQQLVGAGHPEALHLMNRIAEQMALLERCNQARAMVEISMPGLEHALGREHPYYGEALAAAAACELQEGHAGQAAGHLERAIAIEEKGGDAPVDRGVYRFRLARALWSLGRRDAALAAARKAERELDGDADGARDLAAVRSWLAEHR